MAALLVTAGTQPDASVQLAVLGAGLAGAAAMTAYLAAARLPSMPVFCLLG